MKPRGRVDWTMHRYIGKHRCKRYIKKPNDASLNQCSHKYHFDVAIHRRFDVELSFISIFTSRYIKYFKQKAVMKVINLNLCQVVNDKLSYVGVSKSKITRALTSLQSTCINKNPSEDNEDDNNTQKMPYFIHLNICQFFTNQYGRSNFLHMCKNYDSIWICFLMQRHLLTKFSLELTSLDTGNCSRLQKYFSEEEEFIPDDICESACKNDGTLGEEGKISNSTILSKIKITKINSLKTDELFTKLS
ncbi:UNVERIFIED_CONTAM: hypothetical protein NCL1_45990 [Trichonephila clavipes]